MGLLDAFRGDREEVDGKHHSSISHTVIGGAVAYEAAKAWEDHCAKNGKPDNHAQAKQVAAGLLAAVATNLFESKGLDALDDFKRKQAMKHAEEQIGKAIESQY